MTQPNPLEDLEGLRKVQAALSACRMIAGLAGPKESGLKSEMIALQHLRAIADHLPALLSELEAVKGENASLKASRELAQRPEALAHPETSRHAAALQEIVRLRLATSEGTCAQRFDRAWQVATNALEAGERAACDQRVALVRVRDWINTSVPIGTEAATTILGVVMDAIAAGASPSPPSSEGEGSRDTLLDAEGGGG